MRKRFSFVIMKQRDSSKYCLYQKMYTALNNIFTFCSCQIHIINLVNNLTEFTFCLTGYAYVKEF